MQKIEITLPYCFTPRPYQLPVLDALDSGIKRAFITWHRRSGKDKCLWNYCIKRAFDVVGQHYYLFPTFAQARKALWEAIDNDGMKFLDHIPKEIIDGKPNDSDMQVTLKNGSIIQLIGTDNFDSIRGTNPKTCIFSEYAYQDPRAWGVISPILRANGGIAIFNTTPNGENHALDLKKIAESDPKWFFETLTVDDTDILTKEDIEEERKNGMPEEMVQQEFYCSWNSALVGAYYAERLRESEEQNRITLIPWQPYEPVFTFWDLGINDEMSIWFFQQKGYAWHAIDFLSDHGKGFEYYANAVYRDRPYTYGKHYVPHDAKNRELNNGLERSKTLDTLLRDEVVVMKRPKSLQDKIDATRFILPKVYFDQDKCKIGIQALKNYRQEYDDRLKRWKDHPLHDWSSNPADAFSYFSLMVRQGEFEIRQDNRDRSILTPDTGAFELIG